MGTSDAWAEYFAGPVPPDGGVNWEAYSHAELYQMLWQDADVADVGAVATEWAKHRVALSTHAQVLREQSAALRDSWHGQAADEAARRLVVLAARVEKIGELAAAGEQAAQEAANGLAMARVMMPPPSSPSAPLTEAAAGLARAGAGAPAAPAFGTVPDVPVPVVPSSPSLSSLQSYMSAMQSYLSSMQSASASNFAAMLTGTPFGTPTATPTTGWSMTMGSASSGMGTAFGAVGAAGFSFYGGSAAMDEQKAQAVRAMRAYESSLTSGSQLISQARGTVPEAAPIPRAEPARASGVPWQRLVGAAPAAGPRTGTGAIPRPPGGPGSSGVPGPARGVPLGPGARAGTLPGGPGVQSTAHLAETATARPVPGQGGMVPPVAGQRGAGAEEDSHENRMPTVDHRLFAVDEPVVPGVIGQEGDGE